MTTDVQVQESVQEHSTNEKNKKKRSNWDEVSRTTWETKKKLKNGGSDDETKGPRQPKRKVACLIGYCGTGYHGMQMNPPNNTIEGTLFDAFVKTGAVSQDNADDAKKVSLARAARTDKGVHAAVNVISLKMLIEDPDLLDKINAELPSQIRVWRILRTMKSFNPRTNCDSRIYEYLLPTSAFLPPQPGSDFAKAIEGAGVQDDASSFWTATNDAVEEMKKTSQYMNIQDDDQDIGSYALDTSIPDADKPAMAAAKKREKLIRSTILAEKRKYRISDVRLKAIRETLATYHGTKNFHNYTIGQQFKQPNSSRVIRSFEACDPFLINGTEWVSLKVHGQSFMLHQIRKMVAMTILVIRTGCPLSRMARSFTSEKLNIPKAPSLGLLLERPVFEVYNRKAGENEKQNVELGPLDDVVTKFKMTHVYDKIYAEEETACTFYTFLASLDAMGNEFSYLLSDDPYVPPPRPSRVVEEEDDESSLTVPQDLP